MKKIKFFLIFILVACSNKYIRSIPNQPGVDPYFKEYVQEYRNIIGHKKYEERFNSLSMNFVPTIGGNVIGRCYWLLNGGYEIEIDKKWWHNSYASFNQKKFLIFHELEHCIRYRMHTDKKEIDTIVDFFEMIGRYIGLISEKGYLPDGCPASIMHSTSIDAWCAYRHYLYYIREMQEN